MGLGLDTKWAGVSRSFGPTVGYYTLILVRKKKEKKNTYIYIVLFGNSGVN